MYNPKDMQFVGKHDYDKDNALTEVGHYKSFSIGIFKWELKGNGKSMKKGKSVVRVSGLVERKDRVFKVAESIVLDLDSGKWNGRKTVAVK